MRRLEPHCHPVRALAAIGLFRVMTGADHLLTLVRTACQADPESDASAASDLAWVHRWESWPTSAGEVREAAIGLGATLQELRFAYWCAARRLHYAFAHRMLASFADEAVALDGPDEFLELLGHAGRAVSEGDAPSWRALQDAASGSVLPASKAMHVLLTSVYTAAHVPEETLAAALEMAREAAASGDVVASYRVVSLLRRAGRPAEAFAALDDACGALASGTVAAGLADHLSERLVTERALLTESLTRLG